MAGKDQVRFQSIMWQAMLKSADLPATDTVVYHGFITSGGQKMSKSLGNVIAPKELVARYGTEATRYLLLRHVHPFEDTDITWERLDEWYTANLVNGLGNLTARIMKMAETHLDAPVPTPNEGPALNAHMEEYSAHASMEDIWLAVGKLDEYIAVNEPFKVIKTNKEEGSRMIDHLVQDLHYIARRLRPFMPQTAQIIEKAIKENTKPENLFARLEA